MEKLLVKFGLFIVFFHVTSCNPYGILIDLGSVENIEMVVSKARVERGVLIINDTYAVWSNCKVVALKSNYEIINKRYEAYFYNRNATRTISELKIPYKIVKNQNQDKVWVIKERDTFGFKLIEF